MPNKNKTVLKLIKTNELPLPDEAMKAKPKNFVPQDNNVKKERAGSGLLSFLNQLADTIENQVDIIEKQ